MSMHMRFLFHPDKAVAAMAFVLERIGPTDKVKLMKLIYLADREHFVQYGIPITGDQLCAMPWGPVPSKTLDMVNGDMMIPPDRVFSFLHVVDNKVELRQASGIATLAASERDVLLNTVEQHGGKQTWDLVHETHELPEYRDCYVDGSSRPISYEQIARHSQNENRYRNNRPVISAMTAQHMNQFAAVDDEL